MQKKKDLIELALREALRERKKNSPEHWLPFCVFDFIEKKGVEIQFVKLPSVEGIYSMNPGPMILIGSERPLGRQTFTGAHEYAHHIFKHGTNIDELKDSNKDQFNPKEFLADTFAGFLLMPKYVVQRAFKIRGFSIGTLDPIEYLIVSSNLGVGFHTLVHHLYRSLRILDSVEYEKLSNIKLLELKKELLGKTNSNDLFVIDKNWEGRPLDLQVGDKVLFLNELQVEGRELQYKPINSQKFKCYEADQPGIGRFYSNKFDLASFIRVSPKKYHGFNSYRHLKKVD